MIVHQLYNSLFIARARKIDFQHHKSLPLQLQSGKTQYFFVPLQNILSEHLLHQRIRIQVNIFQNWKMQLKGDRSIGVRMPVSNKT